MRETVGVSMTGDNLREKLRVLKGSDPLMARMSRSQIVTLAFDEFFHKFMDNKIILNKFLGQEHKLNKDESNPGQHNAPAVYAPLLSFILNNLNPYNSLLLSDNYKRGLIA